MEERVFTNEEDKKNILNAKMLENYLINLIRPITEIWKDAKKY